MGFKLNKFSFICLILILVVSKASNEECGKRKGFVALSFGGEQARKNDWPWLVAFIHREKNQFFCGGSLLGRKHVLSAAHCFRPKYSAEQLSPMIVTAFMGKFDMEVYNELGSKSHSVSSIFVHPDWNANALKYDADIAIIVLRQQVDYSIGIQPICLPTASYHEVVGTETVVGWGKSENSGSYSSKLNKLEVPAINSSHCYTTTELGQISSNRAFCGGYENQSKGPCVGDSGSGFYVKHSARWNVQGIVSSSMYDEEHGCDINTFSLYANVARFINWIGKVMAETQEVVHKIEEVKCSLEKRWTDVSILGDVLMTYCIPDNPNNISENVQLTFTSRYDETFEPNNNLALYLSEKTRVPTGIVGSFPNLQKLYIAGHFDVIDREDFSGMTTLTFLFIQAPLIIIPEDAFSELTNLNFFRLYRCYVKELPKNLFKNMAKIEIINLSDNEFKHLDKDLFASNFKLKNISLKSNQLTHLVKDLFASNSMLQEIDLGFNEFTHLDKNLFASNSMLQEINLSFGKLTHLDKDLFASNSKLKVIILNDNKLTHLDKDSFSRNSKLQTIYLDSNKLTHLDKDLFASNSMLQNIVLGYNKIAKIEVDFTKLPNLKYVELVANKCVSQNFRRGEDDKFIQELQQTQSRCQT